MKFRPISKVFARSLLTAFVMIASLNSFLSFGNYFSDEVLKSVEKHSSDSSILTNQAVTNGTATDQDGNTLYWINYGTNDWAIENAELVTYRDGTPIPQVTDATEWANLTTGAWCYYNNDSTKGRLYNWYAVVGIYDADSYQNASLRKEFAPVGWRVPNDSDWTELENYLIANGYNYDGTTDSNKVAKAMASTTGWIMPSGIQGNPGNNPGMNNSSGLNLLPEGIRNYDGSFGAPGYGAFVWSTKEQYNASPNSYRFYILYNSSSSYVSLSSKKHGFSVRFVRDANNTDTTPPVITGNASLTIQENQTAVSIYSASEDVTWTLSGVDSALFDIDNPTS